MVTGMHCCHALLLQDRAGLRNKLIGPFPLGFQGFMAGVTAFRWTYIWMTMPLVQWVEPWPLSVPSFVSLLHQRMITGTLDWIVGRM